MKESTQRGNKATLEATRCSPYTAGSFISWSSSGMKQFTALLILSLLSACASEQEFSIPSISIEDDGMNVLSGSSNAKEEYHKAYATVLKKARKIENLGSGTTKVFLEKHLSSIVKNLKTMEQLLVKPAPEKLSPVITYYSDLCQKANRKRLTLGNWENTKLRRHKREIETNFSPGRVTLREATAPSSEKKEIPPPVEETPVVETEPAPDPKEENPEVEYRLLYKGWVLAHKELEEAFQNKTSSGKPYEEVHQALKRISGMISEKKAQTLLVCRNFYTRIHEDTDGFTTTPRGAKEEDVLNDLRIVFSGIQKELNPQQGN